MNYFKAGILKALVYADIFNYPLTSAEIERYFIGLKQTNFNRTDLEKEIRELSEMGRIGEKDNYFFLKGKESEVVSRRQKKVFSEKKLEIARKKVWWLRRIPWIKMIGVTGSLAMNNSTADDDIDLIIITKEKRLWLTRLMVILMTELMGCRRRPNDKQVKDKICLNMFLDLGHLKIPVNERNLFVAHEVAQIKILFDRYETSKQLFEKNLWVREYLPKVNETADFSGERINIRDEQHGIGFFDWLEEMVYQWQVKQMARRRTTEVVEEGRVRFHPHDCKNRVLEEYKKRLEQLGLTGEA